MKRDWQYLPALDGLRAFAFLAVFFCHSKRFVPSGYLGVDVFFALSGFLITSLLLREREQYGSINLKNFYARRALRLYPALVVFVTVLVVFSIVVENPALKATLSSALPALVYMSDYLYSHAGYGGPLGHTWSLSAEEHFYLLWPFALMAIMARRGKKLPTLIAVVCFVSLACRCLVFYRGHSLALRFDYHLDPLLIGCMASIYRNQLVRFVGRFRAIIGWTCVAVVVATVEIPRQSLVSTGLGPMIVSIATVFLIGSLLSEGQWSLQKFLCLKPLQYLGKVSYGLYLWHFGILTTMFGIWKSLEAWKVMGALALTIAIASLSYRFVEAPFLRRKAKFTRESPPEDVLVTKAAA